MAFLEQVSIREASMADYPDVMEISEGVYDGFDYLPELFMSWCEPSHAETSQLYVAVHKGSVIGFKICQLVENGQGYASIALRVGRRWSGLGVAGKLNATAERLFRDKHPRVNHELYTAIYGHYIDNMLKDERKRWSLVSESRTLVYLVSPAAIAECALELASTNQPSQNIQTLKRNEISDIFSSQKLCKKLLCSSSGAGIDAHVWKPYVDDFSSIRQDLENYTVSMSGCDGISLTAQDLTELVESEQNNNPNVCISYARVLPLPVGVGIDIFIKVHDSTNFFNHLMNQLLLNFQRLAGHEKISVVVHFGLEHDAENVKNVLNPYFGSMYSSKTWCSTLTVVLQRPLP